MEIRAPIWDNTNVIINYIKENPNNLTEDFIAILKGWNENKINKEFVLYKYEKEYAVFIGEDSNYYVKGLEERIRNIIPVSELPMFVKTVLLPLNDQIVYDLYIEQYDVSFGAGFKKMCDDNYKQLLKENKIKYKL